MTGYKSVVIKIQGVAPLLMHDGKLSDPLNKISKAMKAVSNKKKKTDDDHRLLSELEFLGSVYTSEDVIFSLRGSEVVLENDPKLCMPAANIEAVIVAGARKTQKGKDAEAAVFVEADSVLVGPPSLKKVFSDQNNYFFRKRAKVKRNAVMRTRAIVRDWALQTTVHYLPDVINEDDIFDALKTAGAIVGLGDYCPRFGRFQVL